MSATVPNSMSKNTYKQRMATQLAALMAGLAKEHLLQQLKMTRATTTAISTGLLRSSKRVKWQRQSRRLRRE